MTAPNPPLPTAAELNILHILWDVGAGTVRQVVERMPGAGYTTALKTLQIMHGKGLVNRDESGHAHIYEAAVPREALERRIADDLTDRAFGGSASRLALRALAAKGATEEELAEVRALLDRLGADGR